MREARALIVTKIKEVMAHRIASAKAEEVVAITDECALLVANAETGNPAVLIALGDMHGITFDTRELV